MIINRKILKDNSRGIKNWQAIHFFFRKIKVSLIAQEGLKKQVTETVAATVHNVASPYEDKN